MSNEHNVSQLVNLCKARLLTHKEMLEALTLISTDSWSADKIVESFQDYTVSHHKQAPVYSVMCDEAGFMSVGLVIQDQFKAICRYQIDAQDHLSKYPRKRRG